MASITSCGWPPACDAAMAARKCSAACAQSRRCAASAPWLQRIVPMSCGLPAAIPAHSRSTWSAASHWLVLISTSARLARPMAIDRRSPSSRLIASASSNSSWARRRSPSSSFEQGHVVDGDRDAAAIAELGRAGPWPPGSPAGRPRGCRGSGAPSRAPWRPAPCARSGRAARRWPWRARRDGPPPRSRRSRRPGPRRRRAPAGPLVPALAGQRQELASQFRPTARRPLTSHQRHSAALMSRPRSTSACRRPSTARVQVGDGGLEPRGPVGRVRPAEAQLAACRDGGEVQRVPSPRRFAHRRSSPAGARRRS